MISVHALTEEKREEVKDEFYSQLEEVLGIVPKHNVKLILGNWNAKVGREEVYQGVIGRNSIHENSNDNGKRVVDLASGHNMVVATTVFPHKRIHLGTWISLDGNTVNQIDHILIDRRHTTDITDARSYRGTDCSTDHYLVNRQKISIKPRSERAKVL
ncbi:craniofacial development protein 2-like [Centruroides sculpturatus]|uniref:craniofacial development protein 2-like n=1 Tax=Centruroides sculpturatus TaxID=218467 RepID=UPI000C6E0BF5|nr:craniofacial development protein 2-like [Centruroides sculpturatus]